MTDPVIQLLADRFTSGIAHPDGKGGKSTLLYLPIRNTGLPSEMAEEFARAAGWPHADAPLALAEAVAHTLRTEGHYAIVPQAEYDELRAKAAGAPDGVRVIEVYGSRTDKKPTFTLTVPAHTNCVYVPLATLKDQLQARGE